MNDNSRQRIPQIIVIAIEFFHVQIQIMHQYFIVEVLVFFVYENLVIRKRKIVWVIPAAL
jgi:hypothetical protein